MTDNWTDITDQYAGYNAVWTPRSIRSATRHCAQPMPGGSLARVGSPRIWRC
jgi:hypothetical protein